MEHIYKTKVFRPVVMAIYLALFYGVSVVLLIFLAVKFKMVFIFVIGFSGIIIIPAFYVKRMRAHFMNEVELEFNTDGILIKFFSKDMNSFLTIKQYDWNNMDSFKLYFTQSGYTNLDLYLTGSWGVKEYSFVDKNTELAQKEVSVYNLFLYYCYAHNSNKEEHNNVKLRKGFLLTYWGKCILYILLFLDVLFIVLMLLYKRDKFPFSFISLVFVLTLFAKRASDKITYNKMINYRPNKF